MKTMRISLTELKFVDGEDREITIPAHLVYKVVPFGPGTLVKMHGGEVHVQESTHEIEQLILRATQHGFATLADIPPDPDEKFFATGSLPGPVYVRNTINSRPEDLTLNGVDLRYLIEQDQRMLDRIRADAHG